MTKRVTVTRAQRDAARYVVKRDAATGRATSAAIKKIAAARRSVSRTEGTSTPA